MWPHKKIVVDESTQAIEEADAALKKTELRSASVNEVSQALRSLRERNHFAEKLESIMGGPR